MVNDVGASMIWFGFFFNDKKHRIIYIDSKPVQLPAIIHFWSDTGRCISQTFYFNNQLHRISNENLNEPMKPVGVQFFPDGIIHKGEYFMKGVRHRPMHEGPAVLEFTSDKHLWINEWWINGKRKR